MTRKLKILVSISQIVYSEYSLEPQMGRACKKKNLLVKRFNLADRCALEEALKIKKEINNVEISAALLGPPEMEWILRACLGFGVDKAIHFIINPAEYYDAHNIALALSQYISDQGFDLIFCSYQDVNSNFQVGPAGSILAELLQYPYLSEVASLKIDPDNESLTVKRKLTKGNRLKVNTPLPAVLSASTVLNEPRYISLHRQKKPAETTITRIAVNKEELQGRYYPAQLTELVAVSPFRPRPKQIPLAGGSLTVQERLDFIIFGGSTVKEKSRLLEGNVKELSNELLNYMIQENFL
jgi:electron transfer flavoprotein alpha/beta subunit